MFCRLVNQLKLDPYNQVIHGPFARAQYSFFAPQPYDICCLMLSNSLKTILSNNWLFCHCILYPWDKIFSNISVYPLEASCFERITTIQVQAACWCPEWRQTVLNFTLGQVNNLTHLCIFKSSFPAIKPP